MNSHTAFYSTILGVECKLKQRALTLKRIEVVPAVVVLLVRRSLPFPSLLKESFRPASLGLSLPYLGLLYANSDAEDPRSDAIFEEEALLEDILRDINHVYSQQGITTYLLLRPGALSEALSTKRAISDGTRVTWDLSLMAPNNIHEVMCKAPRHS